MKQKVVQFVKYELMGPQKISSENTHGYQRL